MRGKTISLVLGSFLVVFTLGCGSSAPSTVKVTEPPKDATKEMKAPTIPKNLPN